MSETTKELKRTETVVEEIRYEYKGYPCVVLFMDMGHRCGYVGIPNNKVYSDLENEIDCHGGVTYFSDHLHLQDDEDITWIGFDTAHYGDGIDIKKIREYFGTERASIVARYPSFDHGTIKTLDYCKEQCESMVDQIIDISERGDGE